MPEPGSTTLFITILKIFYKILGWFAKSLHGSVCVNHPQNNATVEPGDLHLEGTHKNAKGYYWLFTNDGDKYWPQCRVNLQPDGTWKQRINVGSTTGPRNSTVLLV